MARRRAAITANPDHAAVVRTRKGKASGATTSHRHPSPARARASDATTSATTDDKASASSPTYALATTSVITRHH
jgi:hypothetical protein